MRSTYLDMFREHFGEVCLNLGVQSGHINLSHYLHDINMLGALVFRWVNHHLVDLEDSGSAGNPTNLQYLSG